LFDKFLNKEDEKNEKTEIKIENTVKNETLNEEKKIKEEP
jgi:hypothetical protein